MKIMVTGASGFVGTKVLRELINKYGKDSIVALSSKKIEGINTVDSNNYDLSKYYFIEHKCRDVDTLLHIGAFTPKDSSSANDIDKSTSNITNTIKLLESLDNLKRIIFTSTLDVYENTTNIISEETPTIPVTMYGWSKLYCEQVVKNYSKQHNINYVILRLGHVYGEGEEAYKKAMPTMIKNAIAGQNLSIFGDGKAIRTFIHIDDVTKAIVNSLNLNSSEVINIVGNEQVTIKEMANMIKELSNDKVDIVYVPTDIKNRDYVFDNSKLMKLLIKDLIPFKEGLEREYKYLMEKAKA